jgi:hypothetical protein
VRDWSWNRGAPAFGMSRSLARASRVTRAPPTLCIANGTHGPLENEQDPDFRDPARRLSLLSVLRCFRSNVALLSKECRGFKQESNSATYGSAVHDATLRRAAS